MTRTTNIFTVLSVSPMEDDHAALNEILRQTRQVSANVKTSPTLDCAMAMLRMTRIPIIVCERDLSSGIWTELLDASSELAAPPLVIVSSMLADNRLWAEALNLGAYDVLAKPFDSGEVCWVLESAWLHWSYRHAHDAVEIRREDKSERRPASVRDRFKRAVNE